MEGLERISEEKDFLVKLEDRLSFYVRENSSGILQEMSLKHLQVPGKRIRSKLVYQLGRLLNVDINNLLRWATACELMHEASLIHDDFQDQDVVRRGSPTFWQKFGGAHAISVGDFFLMLSMRPLVGLQSSLVDIHTSTAMSLAQGQVDEIELNRLPMEECLKTEYISCVRGKTGALFASIAQGVAVLGDVNTEENSHLKKSFYELGVIFQMQDDILDLYGDKRRGLQGADIFEGKCSLLVALHLKKHPEDFKTIEKILLKERDLTSLEDVAFIKKLFQKRGTIRMSIELLQELCADLIAEQQRYSKYSSFFEKSVNRVLKPIQHLIENQA